MAKKVTEPEGETGGESEGFAQLAEEEQPGFLREFWHFLRHNRKWWLTPILIVLALLIVLVVIGQTPLAPFIYPVFLNN